MLLGFIIKARGDFVEGMVLHMVPMVTLLSGTLSPGHMLHNGLLEGQSCVINDRKLVLHV
jgi:hypothetical protein